MKHSCGAVLYTMYKGEFGIILGAEGGDCIKWFHFKGCNEIGETYEDAALREVEEETGGLVKLTNLSLDHNFATKRKFYHMGLAKVNSNIIKQFNKERSKQKVDVRKEKKELRFFSLTDSIINKDIHDITKSSIIYYWDVLVKLRKSFYDKLYRRSINHEITHPVNIIIKNVEPKNLIFYIDQINEIIKKYNISLKII